MPPTFAVFPRRHDQGSNTPTVTLYKGGTFALNAPAYDALGQPEAVELLFAHTERIIGFRAVSSQAPAAYAVRPQPGTRSVVVSGKAFLRHWDLSVETATRYPATLSDGILAVDLCGAATTTRRSPPDPAMGTEEQP